MAAGYSVSITAVDRATKVIDGINKKIMGIRAPVDRLGASLAKFGKVTQLEGLAKGMQSLGRNAIDAFRNISQIIAPLGAITGAASLAGMYRMVASYGLWAQHLGIISTRVGVAAPKLAHMENVAALAGSSAGDMDAGLKSLMDTMTEINAGGGAEQQKTFKAIGLSADFSKKGVLDVAGAMDTYLAALRRVHNPALQAQAAQAGLGGAAEGMLPVYQKSAEEIDRLNDKVRAHGELTEEARKKLDTFQVAQTNLGQAVGGVGRDISVAISGPLTHLLDWLTDILDKNRDVISAKFGQWAQQLSDWIDKIDWDSVGTKIGNIGTGILSMATAFKGAIEWTDKMGITGEVLGGILLLKVLGPLTGIVAQLGFLGGYKLPVWLGSLLGLSAGGTLLAGVAAATTYEALHAALRSGEFGITGASGAAYGGGGYGTGAARPGDAAGGPSGRNEKKNANSVIDWYMQNRGYDLPHAAAMAANVKHESDFDPQLPGDHGTALGLFQDRGERRTNFEKQYGHTLEKSTANEQLAFADWELHNTEKTAGNKFFAAQGAGAAGVLSTYFERPQDKPTNEVERTKTAARYISDYQPTAPAAAGPSQSLTDAASRVGGPGAPGPNGQVDVNINHNGAPPGTTITANASGSAISGPPRIEQSMANPGHL